MPEPELTPPSATDSTADRRHAERRRSERRRLERALWQGAVGLLFGLVAVAIALVVGWRVLALERSLEAERNAARLATRDLEHL